MTDLRTAAQQALEFLDAEFGWSPGEAPRIDALRAALAQQQTKRACCTYPDCRCPIDKSTVCAKGLPEQAEPVQEPVAWMFELARNFNLEGYGGWEKRITEYRPNTPEGSVRNVTPLYTTPPQRKPLTEEEIDAMWRDAASKEGFTTAQFVRNFTRAIEHAHGIGEEK